MSGAGVSLSRAPQGASSGGVNHVWSTRSCSCPICLSRNPRTRAVCQRLEGCATGTEVLARAGTRLGRGWGRGVPPAAGPPRTGGAGAQGQLPGVQATRVRPHRRLSTEHPDGQPPSDGDRSARRGSARSRFDRPLSGKRLGAAIAHVTVGHHLFQSKTCCSLPSGASWLTMARSSRDRVAQPGSVRGTPGNVRALRSGSQGHLRVPSQQRTYLLCSRDRFECGVEQ